MIATTTHPPVAPGREPQEGGLRDHIHAAYHRIHGSDALCDRCPTTPRPAWFSNLRAKELTQ
jgi:hypothetical protein